MSQRLFLEARRWVGGRMEGGAGRSQPSAFPAEEGWGVVTTQAGRDPCRSCAPGVLVCDVGGETSMPPG